MKKLLPCLKSRDGQVVLTILLVMSVILVVSLSIASRSVTDIKISQQSQESARALWVAQAGLEQALKANQSVGSELPSNLGGVEYSVKKAAFGVKNKFVFPVNLAAGEAVTLWLANHDDAGKLIDTGGYSGTTLTFYWGNGTLEGDDKPALEATLIYKDGINFLAKRYVYDPIARTPATNFTPAVTGCGLDDFSFCSGEITLPVGTVPYFVRVKLLFNPTSQPVGVVGDANFPPQGNSFESTATVTESGVTEKLVQYQFWETTPPIFDYVLFSGADIQ